MSTPYRRDLERLQYWQGQTLRSRDARDQGRFDALRRQLHNRALHSTGGVAFGLQVQLAADDPGRVEVACGLAYDLRGRELILQRAGRAPLPTQASWLVLRLRATSREGSSCCVPTDPGCMPDDARLLEGDVELAWVALASLDAPGAALLARFDGTQLDAGFTPTQARPLAKPRLARGETVKGDTPWEPWTVEQPDGQGGIVSKVVGVQTHIDTSASGFTQTPRYVANVQAQTWDLTTAEFAPAFFPQVADPAADGFTFRLLMTEIARRRYGAWFGSARVTSATRGVGDQLSIKVDDASVFKQGDVIAQLRPRARTVVTLATSAGSKLTLDAALTGVEEGSTVLAVGNLPRIAKVIGVLPDDPAMVAAYTASPAVKKGDVLQRTSDGALALIDRVATGMLTVEQPPANWKATDALVVARMTEAADVKTAALSADGASLVLELKPATHGIKVGMAIAMLDADRQPLASVPKVTVRSGGSIEVQPVPSAAEILAVSRVAPFSGGLTIQSLSAKSRSLVELDDVAPFVVGDFVAASDDPTQIALVEQVLKGKNQLGLSSALGLAFGSQLVAADWQCATTIAAFDPKQAQTVRVGRADAARAGDLVALRASADVGSPVSITSVAGAALTLASPLVGAVRLDTLAVGRFGRVATVVAQQAQPEQITIAEPGALVAGDCVMLWPASGAVAHEAAVVQVASASGTQVVLAESLGPLGVGDRIATVQWRDSVAVTHVDAVHPTQIGIAGEMTFGARDVVGVLSHHADASNGAYVQKIADNALTLMAGIAQGDGIVDQGWIDGGIVGPAALSYEPSSPFSFPAPWQPLVRMDTIEGLDSRTLATAYGLDLVTGTFQSRAVMPFVLDASGSHLLMFSPGSTPAYRFRPETLSLITSFNSDFPAAFVTFAQKQQLVVRWFGCQQEFPPAGGCPGQSPYDPCVPGE
jgi:hypothetical protein